jgi:DNA-binding transcriptional MocR family regulator
MKRYQWVANQIQQQIEQGAYPVGSRIPGTRNLVQHFGVSVSTIMSAQRLLEQQGWVEALPRSGYYVRSHSDACRLPQASCFQVEPVLMADQQLVMALIQATRNPDLLPLGAAVPGRDLLPLQQLRQATRKALHSAGYDLVQYQFPPGNHALRKAFAELMAEAGCQVSAEEIIITQGCHEALRIALRAVAKAGDVVVVESPAYYGMLQLIDTLGLRALEIPADPQSGISLSALQLAVTEWPVKAIMIMANYSNPTGATLSDAHKYQLLQLCRQHDVALIENDIYGELHHGLVRPLALKSFDTQGQVLYCNSLSKSVSPGVRLGWISPGKWLAQAEYLQFTSSLASSSLAQYTLLAYLQSGFHRRHVRRLAQQLRQRVQQCRHAIINYFPKGTRVSQPAGGFVLWIELAENFDSEVLYSQALSLGVTIAPGVLFSPNRNYRNCLRINCGLAWTAKLEWSIASLGQLLHQQLKA